MLLPAGADGAGVVAGGGGRVVVDLDEADGDVAPEVDVVAPEAALSQQLLYLGPDRGVAPGVFGRIVDPEVVAEPDRLAPVSHG